MAENSPADTGGLESSKDPSYVGMDQFEPSKTTLERFHGTRKKDKNSKFQDCGFKLPGLFDTQHYVRDRGMFIFAMFLELVGVAALGQVLYSASNLSQGATFGIAAVFVIVDLLLAYFHTAIVAVRVSRIENDRLRIFPDFRTGGSKNRSLREYYELGDMTMSAARVLSANFLGFLIFVSAVVKSLIFYTHWQDIQSAQAEQTGSGGAGGNFGFVLFAIVLLSYLIVAFIHYLYTGYYGLGFFQKWEEKRDRKQRNSADTKEYCLADSRTELLPSMADFIAQLNDPRNQHPDFTNLYPGEGKEQQKLLADRQPYVTLTTRNRRHRLHQDADGAYYITAFGLLTDNDLIELVSAQKESNRAAKAAVALYGHHLQLRILDTAFQREEPREFTASGQSE